MMHCYVVFTDPGHVFESIHRTVDGATAMAASIGAASMPDGSEITIDAVTAVLRHAASISFACHAEDGIATAHIERHAILV
ncbi:hypothetical protein [Sphingomonas sp. UYP23]